MNQKATRLVSIVAVLAALGGVVAALILTRPSPPDEFIESLSTPAGSLTKLVVSPDGRHVAAGSAEGRVVLLNLIARRTELLDADGSAPLTMLTFASDGLLLSGDRTGKLRAWQSPDFSAVEFDEALQTRVAITCSEFRRVAGSLEIILGLGDGRIVSIGQAKSEIRESGHRGLRTMLLADQGTRLITAGSEGRIRWHRLEDNVLLHTAAGHDTEIAALVSSPDGDRFASADWNGDIRVWDAESRKVVVKLTQPDAVSALIWTGDRIVTGSWDGYIRVWEVTDSTAEVVAEIDTRQPIHDLAVEPPGDRILTVSNDDAIDVWRLNPATDP